MSLINILANKQLKSMGCKWNGFDWEAPDLAQDEVQAIKNKFYNDLVSIEVTLIDKFKREDLWGSHHGIMIAGYLIATASGRDSGAKLSDGVAIMKGYFASGGSIKNFVCKHSNEMILRLKVSRNALHFLDEEVSEGRYSYVVMNTTTSKEDLDKEKKLLLERLSKIESMINDMNN